MQPIIPITAAVLVMAIAIPSTAKSPIPLIATTETAIRSAYFAKADRRITLTRITISQNWALSRWQGAHDGGMVVFKQTNGQWSIVRGTGGAFTYQDLVTMFNMPPTIATDLITRGAPEMMDSLPIQIGQPRNH